jgi:hypothetical protein
LFNHTLEPPQYFAVAMVFIGTLYHTYDGIMQPHPHKHGHPHGHKEKVDAAVENVTHDGPALTSPISQKPISRFA